MMQTTPISWNQARRRSRYEVFGTDDHDFRFFVFICLFIFFLAGVVSVVIGASLDAASAGYLHFLGPNYRALVMAMVTLGGAIMASTILSSYGAYNNINPITNTFNVFIFFILVAQLMIMSSGISHMVGRLSLVFCWFLLLLTLCFDFYMSLPFFFLSLAFVPDFTV